MRGSDLHDLRVAEGFAAAEAVRLLCRIRDHCDALLRIRRIDDHPQCQVVEHGPEVLLPRERAERIAPVLAGIAEDLALENELRLTLCLRLCGRRGVLGRQRLRERSEREKRQGVTQTNGSHKPPSWNRTAGGAGRAART